MVKSMSSLLVTTSFLAIFVGLGLAGDFLGIAKVSIQDLESQFLEELSKSTNPHSSAAQVRLVSLEASLRPMFDVVPKQDDGTIAHNVVCYVLHRFFVRHHGWFIRGLEPSSEFAALSLSTNPSNASNAPKGLNPSRQALQTLEEWVPSYLQNFLETMIGGRGVTLRELAVFAATIIDLVHKEEIGHLHKAYDSLQIPEQRLLTDHAANYLLQVYMTIYMTGGNWTADRPAGAARAVRIFSEKEPSWGKMLPWLEQLQQNIQGHQSANFTTISRIAEEIGERYGVFNDKECSRLKAALLGMESQKPGRVRLSDFYRQALVGEWEFNEKIDYLRTAGLLDESDPNTPLLLVPNYVASRANCLASSSFYAVCCRSECEHLVEILERNVGAPMARPPQISKLVATFTTDTMPEPQKLSKILMQRLQEVASMNHGQVPLHGRLFAQWMHHAFPRECPYPHISGTTNSLTPDEWVQRTGSLNARASQEEMMTMIGKDTCRFAPKGIDCHGSVVNESDDAVLPWDRAEELLIIRELPEPVSSFISDVEVFQKSRELRPLRDVMTWLGLLSLSFMVSACCWRGKFKPEKPDLLSYVSTVAGSMAVRDDHAGV